MWGCGGRENPSSVTPQDVRISTIFPTLVGETDVADSELNAALAEHVHALERSSPDYSALSTVNRGWQSGFDLLEHDAPAICALRRHFDAAIETFLADWGRASFGSLVPRSFRYKYNGWAVILRGGGFQHEHVHTRSDLVGVYYVSVPQQLTGGELTLIDPRAGRLASRAMWDSSQLSITPRAGLLVLFPTFVPHRVDQLTTDGERISINFDVTLEGLT